MDPASAFVHFRLLVGCIIIFPLSQPTHRSVGQEVDPRSVSRSVGRSNFLHAADRSRTARPGGIEGAFLSLLSRWLYDRGEGKDLVFATGCDRRSVTPAM
uniref:Secreted protein n=1 Tax=Anopheles darlingi TaxID=43151 RepID=A0A2M4DS00_ANODA